MDGRVMISTPFETVEDMWFLRDDKHIACYIHVDFKDIVKSTPEQLLDVIESKVIVNGYLDGIEYFLAGADEHFGTIMLGVDGYIASFDN